MLGIRKDTDYFPYPTRTMCFLDILDNLPRLRFSEEQMKMILWVMSECGAHDVPSLNAFRQMQKDLRVTSGIETVTTTSDLGNVFSTNSLSDIVSKEIANPLVSPYFNYYPNDTKGEPITETWQVPGGRWREVPIDMLPPSVLVEGKRYYIHELVELQNGQWVIPQIWITEGRAQKLHADCYYVERLSHNDKVTCRVIDSKIQRFPVAEFRVPHTELLARYKKIYFDGKEFPNSSAVYASQMPNCNRQIDGGEDLFTIWVSLWADDVSGARSKQYQKHYNLYAQTVNLPGKLLQQEYFVHALSASPHASSLEQFKPIAKTIRDSHKTPIPTYNAATRRPCRYRLLGSDLPADNPQQSDESCHIGHQGLCKCRVCMAGGKGGFGEATRENYHEFYAPGPLRNVESIKACVTVEQIRLATFGVASRIAELQKSTGVKDKIAMHWIDILIPKARQLQAANPQRCHTQISNELLVWLSSQTDEPFNPLLNLPFLDPSQDTLVEILHTILLGTEKYGWWNLHSQWSASQQELFTARLQASSTSGLDIPPIRAEYMMQYRNGLIGKHFKTLSQLTVFHLYGIANTLQFNLARALGDLAAVLWIAEIDDMDQYIEDLTIFINNVLDAFADIDPLKILVKVKLHMLVHLPSNIRRRGPAVRFATEIQECFNAIFRLCSVLSNHQAPSRDIAIKLADLERVKHLVSGGFWEENGVWVSAGESVKSLLAMNPTIQSHIGWKEASSWSPGSVRAAAVTKGAKSRTVYSAAATGFLDALNPCRLPVEDPSSIWVAGVRVTALSGDAISLKSWAIFQRLERSLIGQVQGIYLSAGMGSQGPGYLLVQEYELVESLHPKFGMPALVPRSTDGGKLIVLPSSSLQFIINVQHDCEPSGCAKDGVGLRTQERQVSGVTTRTWNHRTDGEHARFVINMHAFHNARRLRRFLPRYMTVPRPLHLNREQRLRSLGADLELMQVAKKAETARKSAATRALNKEKQAAASATQATAMEPRAR
ncbi:hypothetical protein CYLTODRAFT_465626 [Cylindrobasidium torrendii FP15055 ss-10]|uniref:Uncharacterized protein n=1 Tax=Cylindrobasidium torrendii FP15055 ss-10 TaxID=1314674 RepID=A0A0D7BNU7_9AGAR|nr:hypothetical protein CYLTODRAFT_465626 [Cylindrobasidium torrendii FP15055 ss-10]